MGTSTSRATAGCGWPLDAFPDVPAGRVWALRHRLAGARSDIARLESSLARTDDGSQKQPSFCVTFGGATGQGPCADALLSFSMAGHLRHIRVIEYMGGTSDGVPWQESQGTEDIVRQLESFLTGTVLAPAPADAASEWSTISGIDIPIEADSEQRLALADEQARMIYHKMEQSAKDRNTGMLARVAMGVARFAAGFADPDYLASVALLAFEGGLRREASLLAEQARACGCRSPWGWSWLGCVYDRFGLWESALGCFDMAICLGSTAAGNAANIWWVGRHLLEERLRSGRLDGLLRYIDLIARHEPERGEDGGVPNENHALVLASIGLWYEGSGDGTEAAAYYRRALEACGGCTLALAGLNRLDVRDAVRRGELYRRALACYPQTPEEAPADGRVPVCVIAPCPHGSHWETLVPDVGEMLVAELPAACQEGVPVESRDIPPEQRGTGQIGRVAVLDRQGAMGLLQRVVLSGVADDSEGWEVGAFFPASADCPVCELAVERVQQYGPDGMEAVIDVTAPGGHPWSVFDVGHCLAKARYRLGYVYDFQLAGFCYSIAKAEPQEWDIDEGPAFEMERERLLREDPGADVSRVRSVTITMPSGVSILMARPDPPGDAEFRLPVLEVDWAEYAGSRLCRIVTRLTPEDEEPAVRAVLYAGAHVLDGYYPLPGDDIEGVLWLTGHRCTDREMPVPKSPLGGRTTGAISWVRGDGLPAEVANNPSARRLGLHVLELSLEMNSLVDAILPPPVGLPLAPDFAIRSAVTGRTHFVYGCFVEAEPDGSPKASPSAEWLDTRQAWCAMRGLEPMHVVCMQTSKAGKGYAVSVDGWTTMNEALEGSTPEK